MQTQTEKNNLISVEEYFAGELIAETKHELTNGHVYAMVGTSRNHQRIYSARPHLRKMKRYNSQI